MWVARDKNNELYLHFNKPRLSCTEWDGDCYNEWYSERKIYLGDNRSFSNLKWEDEPIEVDILPKPTEENIQTNPIYRSIFDLGKKESDNKIGENLKIRRQPLFCKNCGHPWCRGGYCTICNEWNLDMLKYIEIFES